MRLSGRTVVGMALVAVLAAGCSAGSGGVETNPRTQQGQSNAKAGAAADVPAVVTGGTNRGATRAAVSYAYVSETNQVVFLDERQDPVLPNLALTAVPNEIAVDRGLLVLTFPTGEVATIDVMTRKQVARVTLSALRSMAAGGDLILDELLVPAAGQVLLAGRLADKRGDSYRSFLTVLNSNDLSTVSSQILSEDLGVIQDAALAGPGAVRALLSDGRQYEVRTKRVLPLDSAGDASQVLRYGAQGRAWIGSGDDRPGLLTPSGSFVRLERGRVTDIVPLPDGQAAVLTSQPPQVLIVDEAGAVARRVNVDDYPYAAVLVEGRLHVGSANGEFLQIVDPSTGAVTKVGLGMGVVRVGALPPG